MTAPPSIRFIRPKSNRNTSLAPEPLTDPCVPADYRDPAGFVMKKWRQESMFDLYNLLSAPSVNH
jgi:hypothetical protein